MTEAKTKRRAALAAGLGKLVIPLFLVAAAFCAYSMVNLASVLRQPVETREFVPEYSYSHRANLDYTVALKPNSLFDRPVMDPGQAYFTRVVRHLEIRFTYGFKGDPRVPVSGTYGVNAVLSSGEEKVGEGQTATTRPLWEKQYQLVGPTPFQGDGSVNLSTVLYLNPEQFQEAARLIGEEIGAVTNPTSVRVHAWVKTSADLPSGQLTRELEPTLLVPLGQAYFRVAGNPTAQETDTVGHTVFVTRQEMVDRKEQARQMAISSAVAASLMIPLALPRIGLTVRRRRAVQGTRAPIRRLRGRLAQAGPEWRPPDPEAVVVLGSLDDLARVADEVGRPVICHLSTSGRQRFFLFDGSLWYLHEPAPDGVVQSVPAAARVGGRYQERGDR